MKKLFSETEMAFFWNKKVIVSYILCVLVFFIHISSSSNYDNSINDATSIINNSFDFIIKKLITPTAVPLFFIISGFTFFRNYDNNSYLKKLKSRAKTLVIPYFSWNIIWMIFTIIMSYSFLSNYFIGREKFHISAQNIFLSVFHHMCNGPFWFIFNLIIFTLASPVIYYIMKNKYVGLGCIAVVLLLMQFGITLPEPIFFEPNSIIFYLVGVFYGIHCKKLFTNRTTKLGKVLYGSLFTLCIVINTILVKESITLSKALYAIFLFVFCISLWRTADILVSRIKHKPFMTRSFMVFAMHVNISAIITKLFFLVLPISNIFCIPNTILTITTTLAIINLICVGLKKFLPKLYNLLSGER